MLKLVVFFTFLLVCCGYAWFRGGAPERIAATIFAVGTALTIVAAWNSTNRFGSFEVGIFVVDLACLVGFLILALHAERYWPLWVTALQIIGTAGHAMKLADPGALGWAYAFLLAFGTYPMLALIALGTWRHQRRLALHGVDPSWSTSSARSERAPPAGPIA